MAKKVTYEHPQQATYYYRKYMFKQGVSLPVKIGCLVFEESPTQYHIRITSSNTEIAVGKELWVKKSNIKFPKAEVDCTDAWYHN